MSLKQLTKLSLEGRLCVHADGQRALGDQDQLTAFFVLVKANDAQIHCLSRHANLVHGFVSQDELTFPQEI